MPSLKKVAVVAAASANGEAAPLIVSPAEVAMSTAFAALRFEIVKPELESDAAAGSVNVWPTPGAVVSVPPVAA